MRCENCRYWGQRDQPEEGLYYENVREAQAGVIGVDFCGKVVELWESTIWQDDGTQIIKPALVDQKSFVQDGEEFRASLWTRPDFFCAHFELPTSAPAAIPEHLDEFTAYYRQYPMWGSLHVVLDDGNVEDDSVQFCIDYARKESDAEGERLGKILLTMTRGQRRRLSAVIK